MLRFVIAAVLCARAPSAPDAPAEPEANLHVIDSAVEAAVTPPPH